MKQLTDSWQRLANATVPKCLRPGAITPHCTRGQCGSSSAAVHTEEDGPKGKPIHSEVQKSTTIHLLRDMGLPAAKQWKAIKELKWTEATFEDIFSGFILSVCIGKTWVDFGQKQSKAVKALHETYSYYNHLGMEGRFLCIYFIILDLSFCFFFSTYQGQLLQAVLVFMIIIFLLKNIDIILSGHCRICQVFISGFVFGLYIYWKQK